MAATAAAMNWAAPSGHPRFTGQKRAGAGLMYFNARVAVACMALTETVPQP